ncbi:Holliday junction resolvase RuvX [Galactobacter valiniphilus]|uniref:Putative pre-16S rRNA nuclease n=1 Tax=Galactobacter valiniphilus TaxID=2676122 RepID=A0A399JD21_9MICC|nr:Holliday junction resolvase RuvX [Galactobacter valiniphilus]RII43124.1 Holliday junction resolvase RuvX [Galactobacter valiniphilus]
MAETVSDASRGGDGADNAPTLPRGVRLGVDVGKARVGLAQADPDGLLATPVRTLRRDPKKNSDQRLLVEHALSVGAVTVYVGLPRNLSGGHTPSTQDALDYSGDLAEALAAAGSEAQVRMIDERLSTVSAQRQLHENGLNVKNSRSVIDQAAAVAILQQALDMQKSLGRPAGQPLA